MAGLTAFTSSAVSASLSPRSGSFSTRSSRSNAVSTRNIGRIVGKLAGPDAAGEQHSRWGVLHPSHVVEQCRRSLVQPLQVVEHDRKRCSPGEMSQQRKNSLEEPAAIGRCRGRQAQGGAK